MSKNQKKKQQAGQELALVSLADFEVVVDGARGGGSVPAGVSQLSSSAGRAQGYSPNPARRSGQNSSVKVGGPQVTKSAAQTVEDLSVDDLISKLVASGISVSNLNAKFKATP